MLWKCCIQYVSKLGKFNSSFRTSRSVFIPIQRRAMPKNVQAAVQLHSFHTLARLCSKSFKLCFSNMGTKNFQMYNRVKKMQRARDQIAKIHWITEKAGGNTSKSYTSASFDYTKAFDCMDHNKLWKILKKIRIPDHFTCLLRNLCRSRSNSQMQT